MSIEKRFWMIFWYVMSNAGNAYGIMQILIIKHQLVKETCKKIKGVYQFTEINSSGTVEYNLHHNFETQHHGILSHFKTQCIDDTNGSIKWQTIGSMEFHGTDTSSYMEFHGTWSAPISMTRAVPWNSMELGVRQFRWQEQFHGIPWNFKCANFPDMSSSMEFHGTWRAPISITRAVPWNSMELGVRQFRWHEQFHGIPWNSMELEVRQFHWHVQFHRIPWNSMELGGRQFWISSPKHRIDRVAYVAYRGGTLRVLSYRVGIEVETPCKN